MKPIVSIIIVHYHAKRELFNCLLSIKVSHPKVPYEVIVVDNDEQQIANLQLKQKFPWVRYLRSPGNIGFGAGNNLGAKVARGEYLLFLNPDTIVLKKSVDVLVNRLKMNEKLGIIAPQLLDEAGTIYPLQGTERLTPTSGLVAHAIVNRIFPNNPISRQFWIADWDRRSAREVEAVEGSAFMLRQQLFADLEGFDQRFFLYFEETDLCLRVRKKGLRILVEPKAKIIHLSERSTENKKQALEHFRKSRAYFFTKHYGSLKGGLTRSLFWIMDSWKLLVFILLTVLLSFQMNRQKIRVPEVSTFERMMIVKRIIKDSQGQPFATRFQKKGKFIDELGEYRDLFLKENAPLVDEAELEYLIIEGDQPLDKQNKRIFYFQGATVVRDEPKPRQQE